MRNVENPKKIISLSSKKKKDESLQVFSWQIMAAGFSVQIIFDLSAR